MTMTIVTVTLVPRNSVRELIQTIHDISKSLDKKETVDMAILDFTKAFDKVPHKRLMPGGHHQLVTTR